MPLQLPSGASGTSKEQEHWGWAMHSLISSTQTDQNPCVALSCQQHLGYGRIDSTVLQWQPWVPVLLKHYTDKLFQCQSQPCTDDLPLSLLFRFFSALYRRFPNLCQINPPELMWLWLCTTDGSFLLFSDGPDERNNAVNGDLRWDWFLKDWQ